MPTYDYRCKACGHTFELFQSMSDREKRKCPECSKLSLERLIGAGAGLIFKGSGYYLTDYRSKSYEEGRKADMEASKAPPEAKSDSKAAESKPGSNSESKPQSAGTSESASGKAAPPESRSASKSASKPTSKSAPKPKPRKK
ncbi:MAG: zinc ribbon domain-containing protein [Planctomycetota bacterium]